MRFFVVVQQLTKFQRTQSVAQSLCDSWASYSSYLSFFWGYPLVCLSHYCLPCRNILYFCTDHGKVWIYLQPAAPSPTSKLPFPIRDLEPIYYMVSWAHPSPQPNGISTQVQPFFAELTSVTDHGTRSVTIGRSTAMWPNNNTRHKKLTSAAHQFTDKKCTVG